METSEFAFISKIFGKLKVHCVYDAHLQNVDQNFWNIIHTNRLIYLQLTDISVYKRIAYKLQPWIVIVGYLNGPKGFAVMRSLKNQINFI